MFLVLFSLKEYSKADRYLQFLGRDLLERLIIWEMSFMEEDNFVRDWSRPVDEREDLFGLRKSFATLLEVHHYLVPEVLSESSDDNYNLRARFEDQYTVHSISLHLHLCFSPLFVSVDMLRKDT